MEEHRHQEADSSEVRRSQRTRKRVQALQVRILKNQKRLVKSTRQQVVLLASQKIPQPLAQVVYSPRNPTYPTQMQRLLALVEEEDSPVLQLQVPTHQLLLDSLATLEKEQTLNRLLASLHQQAVVSAEAYLGSMHRHNQLLVLNLLLALANLHQGHSQPDMVLIVFLELNKFLQRISFDKAYSGISRVIWIVLSLSCA